MISFSPNIIANNLTSHATYNASGEMIIYGERRITWKEYVPRVFKIANALIKLGVKKDDKVAFMFHDKPEFIEINNGIHVAGGIPCPVNYRFVPKEIEYQGNHSDAKVFLFDDIWSESVVPAMKNMKNIKHFICHGEQKPDNTIDYSEFINSGEEKDPCVANHWDDVAVIIYTGGTTGFPKGVMLTYKSHLEMFSTLNTHVAIRTLTMEMPAERKKIVIANSTLPLKTILGPFYRSTFFKHHLKKTKTIYSMIQKNKKSMMDPKKMRNGYKNIRKGMAPSMPFFHVAGYCGLINNALSGTSCSVIPKSIKFDPAVILKTIEQEKVVRVGNVPTGWKKLLSYPDFDKYDVSSVVATSTGGGPCPKELKQKILKAFPGATLTDSFGQTEMTPVTSFKLDIDPDNLTDRSVGNSIVDVKVVDENNNEVSRGESGEILYCSNTIMKGYYKDEEKTREAMNDGWFRSGDIGYIDEKGEIRVVDRKKECINTGGEKVFPLEVEEIISLYSKVDTVCVIGVPDEEWGNRVRAVIQLKSGEKAEPEEIIDFCRGKMAGYKIPRSIIFVEEVPFSPAGKMLRQKVRENFGTA